MVDLTERLERSLSKYALYEPQSPEYFARAVTVAREDYNLPVAVIANEFQVADSTVARWENGVAVPLPRMRQQILDWIERQIV